MSFFPLSSDMLSLSVDPGSSEMTPGNSSAIGLPPSSSYSLHEDGGGEIGDDGFTAGLQPLQDRGERHVWRSKKHSIYYFLVYISNFNGITFEKVIAYVIITFF